MRDREYYALARSIEPLYPARKSALGEMLIWQLVRFSLRRMFAQVRLNVATDDPGAAGIPILAVANHPSWWDGYLALLISRHFGLRRYLMMDAAQLQRYGFFAWAGCFGVARDDPREVARAVRYAARLLAAGPRTLLWIFPQAAISAPERRPVHVERGAAHIVRCACAAAPSIGVLPVAWQLAFRGRQYPEIYVRTGAITRFDATGSRDPGAVTDTIAQVLTETMDALREDLAAEALAPYRTILRGRRGVNDRFDQLLGREILVPDP